MSCSSDLLLFALCTSPKIHTVPHLPPLPRVPQKRVLENFQTCFGCCENVSPPPPPGWVSVQYAKHSLKFYKGSPGTELPSEYLKKTRALQHFRHIAILHFLMTDISVTRRAAKINRLSQILESSFLITFFL